jgi:hypothetical protein
MHAQTAGAPLLRLRSNATHGAELVDIGAASLPQPRLRLLIMMSRNSSRRTRLPAQPGHPMRGNTRTSAALAYAIGVIEAACPASREE